MNIHEVAKKIRILGIPGDEKGQAITDHLAAKEKAVEKYIEKMLVRWAYTEKVIDPPTRRKENGKVVKGRSKTSDWSPETVEQAAAVWAVREKWRELNDSRKVRLSKDRIEVIKRAAKKLEERPFAVYTLPAIIGPLSRTQIDPEQIDVRFISDDLEGLDLFPDLKKANDLVIAWIAATEKVRDWEGEGMKECLSKYHPDLATLPPTKIDFSQIDPWRADVSAPWQIDKPARVTLFWFSRPAHYARKSYYWKPPFPWRRMLSESDHDDIVFYENYEDPRTFFTIDVSDLDEAARTEREYILRKLGLAERELEAFNFEIKEHTRRFTTTGARPADSTAAMLQERREEERTALEERARDLEKTVLDLRKRLALLDTWRDGSEVQQYIRSMKKALNESNFF